MVLLAGLPKRFLRWLFEHRFVSDWLLNQPGIVSVFEHNPNAADLDPQGDRAAGIGDVGPQRLEIIHRKIINQALPETRGVGIKN